MSDERDVFAEFVESDEFHMNSSVEEIRAKNTIWNLAQSNSPHSFLVSADTHPMCRCSLIPVRVEQPSFLRRVWLRVRRVLSRLYR